MKRVFLIILILVLCAMPILFAACSNVSQRSLLSTSYVCSDDGYELFTYEVKKEGAVVGTMTMKFEPVKGRSVELPSAEDGNKKFTLENTTLLSTDVTMTNGDTITSRVLHRSDCTPIYSYKETKIGGVTKVMQVTYESKYLYADRYVDGEKTSHRHKSANCYDNESLYAIVRASAIGESSYSLSYTCLNPLTLNADGMTVSRSGATVEKEIPVLVPSEYELPEGQEKYTTTCYPFTISTDNKYASSYTMYVTAKSQTIENDKINVKNVKKVIASIVEGEYVYDLVNIEIK